jgi:hypothetical protein
MGGVGKFFGSVLGVLGVGKQKSQTVVQQVAEPQAQPAAPAPAPTVDQTGDSVATNLKKKAKGKSSLTIPSASSTGGTGLNV